MASTEKIDTPTCPFCKQPMQLAIADYNDKNELIRTQHICGCRCGRGVAPYYHNWYAIKRAS